LYLFNILKLYIDTSVTTSRSARLQILALSRSKVNAVISITIAALNLILSSKRKPAKRPIIALERKNTFAQVTKLPMFIIPVAIIANEKECITARAITALIGLPFLFNRERKNGNLLSAARVALILETAPIIIRYVEIQSPDAIIPIIGRASEPNKGVIIAVILSASPFKLCMASATVI